MMIMKGLGVCVFAMLFSGSIVMYVQSESLVNLDLWIDLAKILTGTDHGNLLNFKSLMQKAAPVLATKNIGDSMTVLVFHDTTAEVAPWTKALESPTESATLIQEHTFTPAMKIEELLKKKTVTNINGNKITFERIGDKVTANGHLVTESDIQMGDKIIGHRIAEPLETKIQSLSIIDAITESLGNLLGIQGLPNVVKALLELVRLLVESLLKSLGLSADNPLTFVAPDQSEAQILKKAYDTTGFMFLAPLIKSYVQKYTFPGSFSPQQLSNKNEITNLLGEKIAVIKLADGFLKIGETNVNPNEVVPAKNGFVYNATPKEEEKKVQLALEKINEGVPEQITNV